MHGSTGLGGGGQHRRKWNLEGSTGGKCPTPNFMFSGGEGGTIIWHTAYALLLLVGIVEYEKFSPLHDSLDLSVYSYC